MIPFFPLIPSASAGFDVKNVSAFSVGTSFSVIIYRSSFIRLSTLATPISRSLPSLSYRDQLPCPSVLTVMCSVGIPFFITSQMYSEGFPVLRAPQV